MSPHRVLLLLLFVLLWLTVFADETEDSDPTVPDENNDTSTDETTSDEAPETVTENDPAPENPSDTTPSDGAKDDNANAAEEKASVLSTLYINTVKPGLGSPITEKVFKEKSLYGLFNSCQTAGTEQNTLAEGSICFSDDDFNDRLMFEITYSVPGSDIERAFKDHPPALQLLGNSSESADSEITQNEVMASTSTAKMTVSYFCKKDSDALISLRLKLQFGDGDENIVPIVWTKQCASGVNSQVEFGYAVDDENSGEQKRHPFGSEDDPYVVSPSDVSTEVYAKLQKAGAQQEFLAPLVSSEDPEVVKITVRGNHPNGGTLKGLEVTLFQISYECLTKGSAKIFVSVGIPPFQNLTATWEKDCGGRMASKLSVGTAEGSSDIVDMGKPTPKYMVGIENIGTEHSEEHLHLPGNQSDWMFYMKYGDSDAERGVAKDYALHIGRIGVTVEHPEVIAASTPRLSAPGTIGWREMTNAENSLQPGDKLRVSFHFACRKVGESRLLITVPILDYDTLEFGIAKECDHAGTAHRSKQFVLTVGNVFWGFVVIAVVAGAYFVRRRRKNAGFAPVPVTEK